MSSQQGEQPSPYLIYYIPFPYNMQWKNVKSDWALWAIVLVWLFMRNWQREDVFQLIIDVIIVLVIAVLVVKYVKIGRMK